MHFTTAYGFLTAEETHTGGAAKQQNHERCELKKITFSSFIYDQIIVPPLPLRPFLLSTVLAGPHWCSNTKQRVSVPLVTSACSHACISPVPYLALTHCLWTDTFSSLF